MQKSVVFQDVVNPLMFPLPNRVHFLPVLFRPTLENFLISNFMKPADLFHYSPLSTFQRLLICLYLSQASISAAYIATLQAFLFSSLVPDSF